MFLVFCLDGVGDKWRDRFTKEVLFFLNGEQFERLIGISLFRDL